MLSGGWLKANYPPSSVLKNFHLLPNPLTINVWMIRRTIYDLFMQSIRENTHFSYIYIDVYNYLLLLLSLLGLLSSVSNFGLLSCTIYYTYHIRFRHNHTVRTSNSNHVLCTCDDLNVKNNATTQDDSLVVNLL